MQCTLPKCPDRGPGEGVDREVIYQSLLLNHPSPRGLVEYRTQTNHHCFFGGREGGRVGGSTHRRCRENRRSFHCIDKGSASFTYSRGTLYPLYKEDTISFASRRSMPHLHVAEGHSLLCALTCLWGLQIWVLRISPSGFGICTSALSPIGP